MTFSPKALGKSLSGGDFIIRPEETPSGVFYIDDGFVKASNTTKYGEENLLVVRKFGRDLPSYMGDDWDNRNVGYIAHTDCVVFRRTQEELEDFVENSADALKRAAICNHHDVSVPGRTRKQPGLPHGA